MSRLTITRHTTMAQVAARLAPRIEQGLLAVGEAILEDSLSMVPRETDALAESGRVRQEGSGLTTVVIVAYGHPDFVHSDYSRYTGRYLVRRPYTYAVYVHEDFTKNHDIGQAGFLEFASTQYFALRTVLNVALGRS